MLWHVLGEFTRFGEYVCLCVCAHTCAHVHTHNNNGQKKMTSIREWGQGGHARSCSNSTWEKLKGRKGRKKVIQFYFYFH